MPDVLRPVLRPVLRDVLGRPLTPIKGVGYRTVELPSTVIASAASGLSVAGGWSVGSGTLALEGTNVRRTGQSVLKALTNQNAADQYMTVRIKVPPTALDGNLEFWFWLPALSAGSRYMQIAYSSDTPAADPPNAVPTNRRRINYNSDQYPSSGWHCLMLHKTGKLYSAGQPSGIGWSDSGSPDASEIEFIEIVYGCSSTVPGAERYFLLDQVAVNGRGRPCIMFGFDSAAQNHVDVGLPLFQARGFKGYNAVDGDQMAANTAKISPLYNDGWDVISQGIGHVNYSSNPSGLAADIVSARATMQSLGYTRAQDIFMYPQNARSAANDLVAAANGIRMGVASPQQHMPSSSLGKRDLVGQAGRLPTDGVGVTFTGRWQAWVDECVLSGESMIFSGHDLVTTPSDANLHTSIAEFTALLDYVAALRDAGTVDVLTPSQYLARFGA